MKPKFFCLLTLLALVPIQSFALQTPSTVAAFAASQTPNIAGRWRVKFNLTGVGERNLEFISQSKGSGTFLLLDTGPDDKPVTVPAAWSETTNDRINFSAEVELQLNCCREKGTLIFKGKFDSKDSISGKVIFVGTTANEENFNGFVSTVGSFSAARVLSNLSPNS